MFFRKKIDVSALYRVLCPRTDGIWLILLAFFRLFLLPLAFSSRALRLFPSAAEHFPAVRFVNGSEKRVFVPFEMVFAARTWGLRHRIIDFPSPLSLPARDEWNTVLARRGDRESEGNSTS